MCRRVFILNLQESPPYDLPGYLDLFSYIHNPPQDKYEKAENLIKRILENPNSLKYRD